jgi:hypothetical protein
LRKKKRPRHAAANQAAGNHSGTSPAFQFGSGGSYYLLATYTSGTFVESDGGNDTNNLAVSAQAMQVLGPVIVDNGTAGYTETGIWNTEAVPSDGGTERYATGSGQNTAAWQVSGLPAGLYQVQVTWHAFGNESSNAPYAIYDGSTLPQTVLVNQTMMPSGASFGGAPFQTLATVNITTGTLKVVVSNTGNGRLQGKPFPKDTSPDNAASRCDSFAKDAISGDCEGVMGGQFCAEPRASSASPRKRCNSSFSSLERRLPFCSCQIRA